MTVKIEKIKLMRPLWPGATATASSGGSTAWHLLQQRRDHVWYSEPAVGGAVPDQTITLSWPEPVALDTLVIDRHNLSGSARVRWQLYSRDDQTYDSGWIAVGHPIPWGIFMAGINYLGECWDDALPVRVAERFLAEMKFADRLELTVSDPDNADGRLMIERIPVGLSQSFNNNFSWGAALEWVDSTEHIETEGGGVDSEPGSVYRRLTLRFDYLTDVDRSWLHGDLARSKSDAWFVAAYPSAAGAGVEQLAHMFTGVRANDVRSARKNQLFGETEIVIREA